MSSFEVLRRVTKPTTDTKVMKIVSARYGSIRENVTNDDPVLAARVATVARRVAEKRASKATPQLHKRAFG